MRFIASFRLDLDSESLGMCGGVRCDAARYAPGAFDTVRGSGQRCGRHAADDDVRSDQICCALFDPDEGFAPGVRLLVSLGREGALFSIAVSVTLVPEGFTAWLVTKTAMVEREPTKRTQAPTMAAIVTSVFLKIGSLSIAVLT